MTMDPGYGDRYADLELGELIALVVQGSDPAWHALHARYEGWMRRVIHRRLGRSSRRRFDTDDVLQATFLNALEGVKAFEFRGEASLKGWLRTILTTSYLKMLRHERNRGHDGSPTERMDGPEPPDEGLDRPSEVFSRLELQERMMEAMARLSDEDHQVLVLRHFEGLSWREVGERIGCNEDTAKIRFFKAFDRLRRSM